MFFLSIFMFLLPLTSSYLIDDETVAFPGGLKVCHKDDVPCLQNVFKDYITSIAKGIGDPLNVAAIDPLYLGELPSLPSCCEDPPTGSLTMKNVVVKGLNSTHLDGVLMNFEEYTAYVNVSAHLQVNMDMIYQFKNKVFTDTVEVKKIDYTAIVNYHFDIKTNEKGEKYFYIGTLHIQCRLGSEFEVVFGDVLDKAIKNDPEIKANDEKNSEQIKQRQRDFICDLGNKGVERVYDAWRVAVQLIPLDKFLNLE